MGMTKRLEVVGGDGVDAPAIDLEREGRLATCGALKRFWYVACLSTELTKDKPLARMVFDEPLALFRDANGAAKAVTDRCLHRAARLRKRFDLDRFDNVSASI